MINYQYHPEWHHTLDQLRDDVITVELKKRLPKLDDQHLAHALKVLIEITLSAFDNDGSLYGLFSLLSASNKRVSPFTATRDYRAHIVKANNNGEIMINISPIYRLGPDYPERYQEQFGKKLAKEAILGLVELSHDHDHQTYLLGIDAGVAFKDSNIQHTKEIFLQFTFHPNSVSCALRCETQTMSKTMVWEQLPLAQMTQPSTTTKNEIAAA